MSTLCWYLGFCSVYFDYVFAYENLALHKPTYQQYPYPGLPESLTQSSNAVDGLQSNLSVWGGQCVISDNNRQTATWWVNLTSIRRIHHITITYMTGNVAWSRSNGYARRMLGFSFYVSNTTDKADGTLCFKDTMLTLSTIPAVFNITCLVHGQYVIYYNERLSGVTYPDGYSEFAHNELCEVGVFGCPAPRYYGENCSIPCPDLHCRYCHLKTGTCQECEAGYKGNHCAFECAAGFYGDGCQRVCGHCACLFKCHHVTGECLRGCEPGYKENNCLETCPYGFFGWNCTKICNYTCAGCNSVSGLCDKGCLPGWKGEYCKELCDVGYYGERCDSECGHCYQNETCNHISGNCSKGCDPGYQGPYCNEECIHGKYGLHCAEECGQCSDSLYCYHINGACLFGCNVGFQGLLCKQVISVKQLTMSIDWMTGFYGLLGVLCVSIILIGILIIVFRTSKNRNTNVYQPDESGWETVETGENSIYQELTEINRDLSMYDTLQ